jgi:DNA polymerase III gamma/tau subunit
VLEGDGAGVIRAVDGLADKSVDMQHFARQLLELLRDLVVLKLDAGDPAAWVPEERQSAESLIDGIDILELQRAFRATSLVMDEMTHSPNPKLMLEMGLVRVATRPPLQSVSELLARLDAMQGQSGATGGSSGGSRPRAKKAQATQRGSTPKAEAKPEPKPEPKPRPERQPEPEPKLQEPNQPIMPATKHSGGFHTSSGDVLTPIRRAALQEWEEMVGRLEKEQPALAAVLEHGVPKTVGPERIVLSFKQGSFYGRQAQSPDSIAAIERVAEQQFGARPQIEIRFDEAEGSTRTVAAVAAQRKEAELEAKRKEALNHPRVRDAMDVFPESAGKLNVLIEAE